ncbi:hypothetical protein FQN54_000874 [Arachnomyces sp. PD_36]|nr:hypothetical protein FQN54_000874 [Arachnomyces sp. PD_36]
MQHVQQLENIESLRTASAAAFAKHDFRDIRWVGVFGSFARGTQTAESDVDIVVYRKPLREPSPPDRLHLEDVLPRVWNRSVDIVYIEDSEFRGYVTIESLLCSQTIYGSARDEEVRQLRRKAAATLESGQENFSKIQEMIKDAQLTVEGVSEETFLASPTLQHSTLSQITSILNDLNSKPRGHPMRDAFSFVLFEKAREIQDRLNSTGESSDQLKAVWEIASQNTKGTLENLTRRINKLVVPVLDETRQQCELVQRLNPNEEYDG